MSEIAVIRLTNLDRLIRANYKTKTEFGHAIGKSPSQVSNWFHKGKGQKGIGEKAIRDIENKLHLTPDFLDQDNSQLSDEYFRIGIKSGTEGFGAVSRIFSSIKGLYGKLAKESETIKVSRRVYVQAESILIKNGYTIIPLPSEASSFVTVNLKNGQFFYPDFLIYLPEYDESFYIDIYKERKLKIIEVNLETKSKEVLFVAESEVTNLESLVEKHVMAYFERSIIVE